MFSGCSLPSEDDLQEIGQVTNGIEDALDKMKDAADDIYHGIDTDGDGGNISDKIKNADDSLGEGLKEAQSILDKAKKLVGDDEGDSKEENDSQNNKAFEPDELSRFAYDQLDKEEKECYVQLYNCLTDMEEEVDLSTMDEEIPDTAFYAVLKDHPEIFWTNGYNLIKHNVNGSLNGLSFAPKYNCDKASRDEDVIKIEESVTRVLDGISRGSQYSMIKQVYETIIENTQYDLNSKNNQDIRSVLLNGRSVCQGYAETTQYLLNRLGIFATVVSGTANGGGHSWNLVKVDGAYYHLDTTWGDSSYTSVDDTYVGKIPEINYDYFLVTTDDVKKTHKISDKFDIPKCTDIISNYYVKEGLYFTSVDTDQLRDVFAKANREGNEFISLKCANEETYEDMIIYLIDEQKAFDYLDDATSVGYTKSDENRTLIMWLD